MKLRRQISASVGIATLFAAASLAQQVKTDYDRNASFSRYKTYSWEKVQTQDPLWVDRIKEAVNAALTARGLTPVESGGDIAIVALEATQNQRTLNTFYDGLGGGWRWRGFGGFGEATTTVDTYKVGTLIVDLFDARSKTLVWRGSSSESRQRRAQDVRTFSSGRKELSDEATRFSPFSDGTLSRILPQAGTGTHVLGCSVPAFFV